MISTITGTLVQSSPIQILIETYGIGYEVHIPLSTSEKLPKVGETLTLHTHVAYKEDSQSMYGFHSAQERDFFRLLVEKVSGIGPKIALNILSRISINALQHAIANSDISVLTECPGIGKKTAERLIIELRDKTLPAQPGSTPVPFTCAAESHSSPYNDAVSALISLGFKAAEAEKAVQKGSNALESPSAEALIKYALG